MNYTAEFSLVPNGVQKCLAFLERSLEDCRLRQHDMMESLLICEEVLLLMAEHAPEDSNLRVEIVRKMGVPQIRLTVPGTPVSLDDHVGTVSIDQLGEESEQVIRGIMLRSYADSIKYRHTRGANVMTITTGIPERVLSTHTVTAIVLALVSATVFRAVLPVEMLKWMSTSLFIPAETLFISALMCITAPAVFVSITCSVFHFEGFSDLGKGGKRVICSYLLTSVMATLVGVISFLVFQPGDIGVLSAQTGEGMAEGFSLLAILTTLIPPNIIEPFISVNSIQLMITALAIGTALVMSGKRVSHLKILLEELDVLCGKVSSLVMRVVPVVVYCSTANVVLSSRLEVFVSTAELIVTLLAGLLVMLVLYCLILLIGARLNPITFLKKYAPTMKNTFLKGSGVAAIPMTMRVCRRRLGIPQSICSFSIPLGATINMDGNCVCLTIISLFFARMCGTTFDANGIVVLLLLVLILSLGAPIAPGTLILCLVTLLAQMGIDTGLISFVIGINFILEMVLGMVNSVGDVVVALVVAKQEGSLDLNIYKKK